VCVCVPAEPDECCFAHCQCNERQIMHPALNNFWLTDVAWTFALYMEVRRVRNYASSDATSDAMAPLALLPLASAML